MNYEKRNNTKGERGRGGGLGLKREGSYQREGMLNTGCVLIRINQIKVIYKINQVYLIHNSYQ